MTRYAADSRDRVRDAVDMLALVGAKVELRRAGVNSYFGRCPFHDERTASFHVSPDEKLYHCFGCSESGDPFDFAMQTEGVDFKGALESLADRFGVALATEEEDPAAAAARARRERLYSLLTRAATYYSRYLWQAGDAAPARDYLLARGFSQEVLREFRVGYAPDAWDRVSGVSRQAGYTDAELLAAGLAQPRRDRNGIVDRFRGRIMFPTADARGRVRGFGARAMREDQRPKYLNTSDSELYHKREVLYGIELARAAAARAGRMILVEGYTDVIALHQAGVANVVGIMGTSLTREQVGELARVVPVLELCLDADNAGQDAMARGAEIAAEADLELRVVPLPAGADPGDLIAREGAEALRERVAASQPFVVFAVERVLAASDTRSAEGRERALLELGPLLRPLAPSVLRDELVQRVAGLLGLADAQLARLLEGGGATRASQAGSRSSAAPATPAAVTPIDQGLRAERIFLATCVAVPDVGETTLAAIDPDQLLTGGVHRRAAHHLRGRVASPLSDLPADDDELARVMAGIVSQAGRLGPVDSSRLEHARLYLEFAQTERELAAAKANHAPGISDLSRRRGRLRDEIRAVNARIERAV